MSKFIPYLDRGLGFIAASFGVFLISPKAWAREVPLLPIAGESNGYVTIEYRSGDALIFNSSPSVPVGVELRRPGLALAPVLFSTKRLTGDVIELGPTKMGSLSFRFRIVRKTPSLVERTLEVTAESAQQFALSFPLETAVAGEFASFSGPEKARTFYDTVRGSTKTETFPVVMLRTSREVFGLIADSPGLWENRCQILIDPPARLLTALTGDGRDPYPLSSNHRKTPVTLTSI